MVFTLMNPFVVFSFFSLKSVGEFESNQVELQLAKQYLQFQLFETKMFLVCNGFCTARQVFNFGTIFG